MNSTKLGRFNEGDRIQITLSARSRVRTPDRAVEGPILTVVEEIDGHYILKTEEGEKFLRVVFGVDRDFELV